VGFIAVTDQIVLDEGGQLGFILYDGDSLGHAVGCGLKFYCTACGGIALSFGWLASLSRVAGNLACRRAFQPAGPLEPKSGSCGRANRRSANGSAACEYGGSRQKGKLRRSWKLPAAKAVPGRVRLNYRI
jgi:hypothetical protein